jgi:hypothetical protein
MWRHGEHSREEPYHKQSTLVKGAIDPIADRKKPDTRENDQTLLLARPENNGHVIINFHGESHVMSRRQNRRDNEGFLFRAVALQLVGCRTGYLRNLLSHRHSIDISI